MQMRKSSHLFQVAAGQIKFYDRPDVGIIWRPVLYTVYSGM